LRLILSSELLNTGETALSVKFTFPERTAILFTDTRNAPFCVWPSFMEKISERLRLLSLKRIRLITGESILIEEMTSLRAKRGKSEKAQDAS